jgi:hypothetical protein
LSTKRLGFDVKARSILLAFDPKETLLTAHSWLFPMQNIRLCIATSMLNPGGPPKATHPAVRAVDAAYGKCLIVVPPPALSGSGGLKGAEASGDHLHPGVGIPMIRSINNARRCDAVSDGLRC